MPATVKIRPVYVDGVLFYPVSIFEAIVDPSTRKTLKQTLAALATVASTGSYNDLSDKPTIPEAVVVDSALSSSSENPVQNKVVNTALGKKVDKVSGKGLSANDFTNALKTKLEGLSNYDDAALAGRVATLEAWKTALTGESADSVINTFKEIQDFLAGIDGTDTLSAMLTSLQNSILSTVQGYGYQNTAGVNSLIAAALSGYVEDSDLAAVATSGSYNDLSDKPTIPIVDSSISSTSTNAVQNAVVKAQLDLKMNQADGVTVGTASTGDYSDVTSVIS